MNKENFMESLLQKMKEKYPGYKVIYMSLYGSKLFGLDNPNSDTDYFGLFLPSKKDIYLHQEEDFISFDTNPDEKNTKDDDDIKLFSIYSFFKQLRNGDHEKYDMLFSMFSDKVIYETKESNIIKKHYKSLVLNKPQAFTGFALKQANKYSIKGDRLKFIEDFIKEITDESIKLNKKDKILPIVDDLIEKFKDSPFFKVITKEEGRYISVLEREYVDKTQYFHFLKNMEQIKNMYGKRAELTKNSEGVDFKAFSHALRALTEAKELISEGFIYLPLKEENRRFIKNVKEGVYPDIKYLSNIMEEGLSELSQMEKKSPYPDFLDFKIINNILLEIFELE